MQLEAYFLYRPRLSVAAMRTLGQGHILLSDSFSIHIEAVDEADALESIRWTEPSGRVTLLREHDGRFYRPLDIEGHAGPITVQALQTALEGGASPARDTLAGSNLLVATDIVETAAASAAALRGMVDPIVDNGDLVPRQANAARRWEAMGLIAVGEEVWQCVDEPVLVLDRKANPPRLLAMSPDSQLARSARSSDIHPLKDLGRALSRLDLGVPPPVELIDANRVPAP